LKTKTFYVDQESIDLHGHNIEDHTRCPIAKSVRSQLTRHVAVACFNDVIDIDHQTYELPKKAQVFQERLRSGKSVKPFSFTLR
jgi:hypothetical protein